MNFLGFLLIGGACVYIVYNVVQIVKTLKARKRAASENKTDEKEVDQSNSEKK